MFLPAPSGRYAVGATTFSRFYPSVAIGTTKLRHSRPNSDVAPPEHALHLEEVAFTAYYPTDPNSRCVKPGVNWLIRPLKRSLDGFVKFAGLSHWILWPIVYLFGAFIKIPAYPNYPLLDPTVNKTKNLRSTLLHQNQWPLVIFSHGLGGSRTSYSQICSRIASSGRVVLAIEHRDGTAPICIPRHKGENGITEAVQLYLKYEDVINPNSVLPSQAPETRNFTMRADQLSFRKHEIYYAFDAFKKLVSGEEQLCVHDGSAADVDWESWCRVRSKSAKAPVNCDQLVLAGHSFGGATIFSLLSAGPPNDDQQMLPVSHAIVLDPWLEPLPTPGPAPYAAVSSTTSLLEGKSTSDDLTSPQSNEILVDVASPVANDDTDDRNRHPAPPRLLVINSEVFTLWESHFSQLTEFINTWESERRCLLTLVKSKHESFSDFPLLPLIRNSAATKFMDTISRLCLAFLDDELKGALDGLVTREMAVQIIGVKKDKYGDPKRTLVGEVGDVVVH